jgi:hypothetical protein
MGYGPADLQSVLEKIIYTVRFFLLLRSKATQDTPLFLLLLATVAAWSYSRRRFA